VRVAEVDRNAGVDRQLGVLGKLLAAVPGQRPAQLSGQRDDRCGDGVADVLGAVTGQCRAVLDTGLDVSGSGSAAAPVRPCSAS
jgi:hypothetical protein